MSEGQKLFDSSIAEEGRTCSEDRVLPIALDGNLGTNRASGRHKQIAADTDAEAVRLWLAEYTASPHTLRRYRKEAVRLLLWTTETLGKTLSSLSREDFLLDERFLMSPTGDRSDPQRPRRGPLRRLFDGPLSERSQHQALDILSGLMTYLVSVGYLAGNPLALRRERNASTKRSRRVERYLDHALWDHVLASVEQWPRLTERDQRHDERNRWLIRLLHQTALRVSGAATAKRPTFISAGENDDCSWLLSPIVRQETNRHTCSGSSVMPLTNQSKHAARKLRLLLSKI